MKKVAIIIGSGIGGLSTALRLSSLVNAIKTKSLSTSHQLISKYVKNEKLQNFLAYQSLYVGISPYDGPSIYTLVPVVSQLYGLWHLRGNVLLCKSA